MKLFVIAAILTVCSAGRLEHLEHQRYLPPGQGSDGGASGHHGVGSDSHGTAGNGQLGSNIRDSISRGFDSDKEPSASSPDAQFEGYVYGPGITNTGIRPKTQNNFGHQTQNQEFDQPEASEHIDQQAQNPIFNSQATKQQYGQGPQNQQYGKQPQNQQYGQKPQNQQYGQQSQNQQYQAASQFAEQDETALGSNSIAQARFYPKPASPSGQYYAPPSSQYAPHSSQNAPQQSFDEETGYHY